MKERPSVFISYNHSSDNIVNMLEQELQDIADVHRDISFVKPWDSFKEFMDSIRNNDYAVLVISDLYLKSEACLYEVLQVMKNENWDSHVMFVVEKDAKKVYRTKNQLEYIGYWEKEAADLRDALSGHGFESVIHQAERLKRIEMIKLNIGEFLSKVADANNPSEKEAIRAVIDRIQIAARRNSALTLQNVILSMLKKPHTVNDISKELNRSASTIRRHTKALRDKGAIEMTATGRTKQYQATRK